ncbi:acyltransferase family protein [Dorea sp. ICN-14282]|uniref:acyltransferase family protein n=1 Tax=Dorea sp. ICN-14282 TaxID=3134654 RepID=UPI0030BB8247
MKTVKRYPWIDVLYTIGITLVIFGHSHPSDWSVFSGTIFEKLIIFIYTFHMPLFFFIAGFLFMNSNAIKKNEGGYVKWIENKCIRLLIPYIILSLIALIPKYYLEHHDFITVKAFAEAICIPRIGVWGHFWFIPVLLLCYVIFGMWRTKVTEKNLGVMLSIITIVSFIAYCIPFSTQWFGLSDLKSVCIYFCIGMWLKFFEQYKIQISNVLRWCFIIGGITASCVFNHCIKNSISTFGVSILMIVVCYELARIINDSKVATWISRNNFTIYIYSWLFQAVIMAICGRLRVEWYFTSVLMFLVGFAGPMSVIFIYKKLKFIHNRFFEIVLGMK